MNNKLEYEVIMVTPIKVEIMYTSILFYAICGLLAKIYFLVSFLGRFGQSKKACSSGKHFMH